MIKWLLWVVVVYLVNNADSKHSSKLPTRLLPGRLVPRFDFLEPCKNVSSVTQITNVTMIVNPATNMMTINADAHLDRWVNTITKTIVRFYNCEDSSEGSCQLFQTWRLHEESCRLMSAKDAFWSPYFQHIHPKLRCPVAPGDYTVRNGTLDMVVFQRLPFPLEKYYWRIRLDLFDPERFSCSVFGMRFLRTLRFTSTRLLNAEAKRI